MESRKLTREFKLEAVRLIKDRGVSYVQASQDLPGHAHKSLHILGKSRCARLGSLPRHRSPLASWATIAAICDSRSITAATF
jgi:hypothetical protein